MIDPFMALAAANTAFNGVKKVVEMGREIQDVYSQLSQWAGAISDLHEAIRHQDEKRPGLFEKIGFSKSASSEAFDTYIAKQKIIDMEREIYHMFIYGELQHLGMDGYREFVQTKKDIKAKREKLIYDQLRARAIFARRLINTIYFIIILGLVGFLGFITLTLFFLRAE